MGLFSRFRPILVGFCVSALLSGAYLVATSGGIKLSLPSLPAFSQHQPAALTYPPLFLGGPPQVTTYPNPITPRSFGAFALGYDKIYRNPAWVAYKVFPVPESQLKAPPRPDSFQEDPLLPGVVSSDYTHSGYDRGHMAPNYAIATRHSEKEQLETFYMSNIIPQKPELNRHVWEKLEMFEAKQLGQRETIYVITGPVYEPPIKYIKGKIAIPTACFKLIMKPQRTADGEITVKTVGVIIPQNVSSKDSYEKYQVPLSEIERRTGLNLLPGLPH